MVHPVIAIDAAHAGEIHQKLKAEKIFTGKSIRRIVTDILLREEVFSYLHDRDNRENQPRRQS